MNYKKIFNIAVELDLIQKPNWLDDFRVKYDKPYPDHITLKTNTFFDSDDFENLKKDFVDIAQKYKTINVIFDELYMGLGTKGECIMIKAQINKDLLDLQKEMSDKFSKYGQHITPLHEKFEKDFQPHLTIARQLTTEQLENAKKDLKPDLFCTALVKDLVLTAVENDRFEEWVNVKNKVRHIFSP